MADFTYPGQFKYEGVVYSAYFNIDCMIRVRDELELDPSDVVLITYPKCGTHWLAEIFHNLTIGLATPEKYRNFGKTMPRLEFNNMVEEGGILPYDRAMGMPPPRRLASHLKVGFFERLLKDPAHCPKCIVCFRDPKDALVSYYHFHKILKGLGDLTWDQFFEKLKRKELLCGDILAHHAGWKRFKEHPSVFMTSYEDLAHNGMKEIRRLADFLHLTRSDEDIAEIQRLSSFEQMKARGPSFYYDGAKIYKEAEPPVFRKGVTGDWRNHFTAEQCAYLDQRLTAFSN